MTTIVDMLKTLLGVWGDMFGGVLEIAPKAIMFILWILCAVIILPCVFIAGSLYPVWADWGEKF